MKIIGHRGAKGLAPENTIASFKKALEYHVDEIECDVRVTKDGVPVIIHDQWLSDPAGNHLLVSQHTYAELLQHKPDLPTLEMILTALDKAVPLQIEVKPREPLESIVSTMQRYLDKGGQPDDFSFASKDFRLLQSLHATFPAVQTVVIERWSGVRAGLRARKLQTKRISMNQLWLWRGFIQPMSRRGYELNAYPLNDPRKARRWASYGLAGAITDLPDLFDTREH